MSSKLLFIAHTFMKSEKKSMKEMNMMSMKGMSMEERKEKRMMRKEMKMKMREDCKTELMMIKGCYEYSQYVTKKRFMKIRAAKKAAYKAYVSAFKKYLMKYGIKYSPGMLKKGTMNGMKKGMGMKKKDMGMKKGMKKEMDMNGGY